MKKYIRLLLLLTACNTIYIIEGQAQVISFFETEYGKPDRTVEIPGIVDINSTIKIKLNQDSLATKLAFLSDSSEAEGLAQLIKELNILLENQIEILKLIQIDRKKHGSFEEQLKILDNYSTYMDKFYEELKNYPEIYNEVNRLFGEYFQLKGTLDSKKYPNPQSYILQNLGNQVMDLQNELKTSPTLRQYKIVLLGFLHTKKERIRVHIENFDRYSIGEFYQVEQFVTTFSEEQIHNFQRTQELANGLNRMLDRDFDDLKELVYGEFSSIPCIKDLLGSADSLFKQRDELFAANRDLAVSYLDQIQTQMTDIMDYVADIQEFNNTIASVTILDVFNQRQGELIEKVTSLQEKVDALWDQLPEDLKSPNEPLLMFKNQLDECIVAVQNDIEKIKQLYAWVQNLVKPFKNAAISAGEIGEEVLRYSIGTLPDEGFIDLRYTGKRENTDQLEVKLIVEIPDEGEDFIPRTIETHRIKVQQIKLYSITRINLILAHPYSKTDSVKLTKNFQFAPSGSLLFKLGSRKSNFYNEFLDPGIGFNFSAPDFDLDGTPDFAAGVIVSIVQDILSFGWNYNTRTDTPFIFFGISLPFSTPGLPINSVQVQNLE